MEGIWFPYMVLRSIQTMHCNTHEHLICIRKDASQFSFKVSISGLVQCDCCRLCLSDDKVWRGASFSLSHNSTLLASSWGLRSLLSPLIEFRSDQINHNATISVCPSSGREGVTRPLDWVYPNNHSMSIPIPIQVKYRRWNTSYCRLWTRLRACLAQLNFTVKLFF